MNVKRTLTVLAVTTILLLAFTGSVFSADRLREEEPITGNNLSFPVIAVDGFSITPLTTPSFTVPYTGDYPGLTAEEIAALEASGPWYPQKTEGNVWQAGVAHQGTVDVTFVDWSDNIESVNPKVRRPFRLEIVLFKELTTPMMAYTMAVLEYPSSSTELQGTNTTTYDSNLATVISASPKLVVQYLGLSVPETMAWTGAEWDSGVVIPVSFAPELNVGGKYIFGASQGGWKPDKPGIYRITFYIPTGSGVNLAGASVDNLPSAPVATAWIDELNNLTYVDVEVVAGGGGKGR